MRELEERKAGELLDSDSSKRKLEEDIQLAKLKAQEIVAKLVSNAEAKRPRLDNDFPVLAPALSNYSTGGSPFTGQYHGLQNSSKKFSIPNVKVGLIIGKGGETIKFIQLQSIQITKDTEADPQSLTRDVELMGTEEQISRGEQLINEVIAEKDAEGPASASNLGINSNQSTEQDIVKVPNNKVALLIGKGGETIENIQTKSGAHVQVIPLHLPPGVSQLGDSSEEAHLIVPGRKKLIILDVNGILVDFVHSFRINLILESQEKQFLRGLFDDFLQFCFKQFEEKFGRVIDFLMRDLRHKLLFAGPGGDFRFYMEGLATVKNIKKYIKYNPFGQSPITKSDPYWDFYQKLVHS